MSRLAVLLASCALLSASALTAGCATTNQRSEQQALQGRTVVITGASSGFGRGMAVAFGQRRANVVLAARRTEVLEQVAGEVRSAGGRALVVTTDVGREADVQRLAQAAVAEFGRVDVWINNAGVGALGRFDEVPLADHSRIVDTNLKGVIYGSHVALHQFRRQGQGTLINMGSAVSYVPMPYYASYVATKHGVLGLSNAINQELRVNGERNIHVVTVMPYAADTPWFDHAANYTGRSPRQVLMDPPQKIVDAVVRAAIHPRREVAVGWKSKAAIAAHRIAPGTTQAVAAGVVHDVQMRDAAAGPPPHPGAVHQPMATGVGVEGGVRSRMTEEDRRKAAGD
ncbi:SDR family oxidoreductase [Phenylobacterium deserti]|uniref:Short-chain dehydrogenase n=1 Tax=Phenylobacterium deserti TaxID=1914756 RepID=A0A328AV16_9CAUL|nr:SDR family oxidoreductase [Phenylobacterium deserti]RAK58011.1 short-chain dehydrogenase [Phenylobacterium deserti]